MKRSKLTIYLLLVGTCTGPAFAQSNYSKTVELSPLRISYAELQAVLDKGASLMGAANGSLHLLQREEMRLQEGELRVNIWGHQLEGDARLPKTLDRFDYTAWTGDAAPVSHLSLSFSNYSRTLSVEGRGPDQVDAVFSALRDELSKLSTPIGGPFFSVVRVVLISTLALGLFFLVSWWIWMETRSRIILGPTVLVVVLLIALIILPIGDLLSGFAVVRRDASFIVRYGADISLWGLILGILGTGLSLIPLFLEKAGREARGGPEGDISPASRK